MQIQRFRRRLKQKLHREGILPWPRTVERSFERMLRDRRPDIVLAEFGYNAMYCARTLARHNIPLVSHFHGTDASKHLNRPKYRRALPRLFTRSKAVIVVNSEMAQRLHKLGCAREKIAVIPCGADVSVFLPHDRPERSDGCRFVSVGRFVDVKAPLRTIEAFARCRQQLRCHLTMIGDGPLLEAARALAEKLEISDEVDFRGKQPHDEIVCALSESDVFVHHAVTTRSGQAEGWGVAIAEASATGMPSVTTRNGGIPDQVVDGRTGFLVPEHDTDAMAKRMLQLARDSLLRRRMGRAARAHIEQVGDQRKQIEKLAQVLAQATAQDL